MINQNVWGNVDILDCGLFGLPRSLTIKKNVGGDSGNEWVNLLTVATMLVGIGLMLSIPENRIQEYPDTEDDLIFSTVNAVRFWLSIFPIVYCLVYAGTYGKMTFTGETKRFLQYTRAYSFAGFVFGLGVMFLYRSSGWWFWLSFIFFGLGAVGFWIAGIHWSEHKNLVYQFNWKDLGDGQKFLIIQNGINVMLYELKDEINKFEYEKIVQQNQKALKSYLDERKEAVRR
jgi:hypothetical protein